MVAGGRRQGVQWIAHRCRESLWSVGGGYEEPGALYIVTAELELSRLEGSHARNASAFSKNKK